MISPQELQSKKFEKAVFGGYDMAGVDEFLDLLLPDYAALYKENSTLKSKMKVLVDKIEEYRSVDEEMRKALYGAQVSSKEIVQKARSEGEQITAAARAEAERLLAAARAEAERMVSGARAEAEGRVVNMQQSIQAEQQRLKEAQEVSGAYAAAVVELLKKSISAVEVIAQKPVEDYIAAAAPPVSAPPASAPPVKQEPVQQPDPAPRPDDVEQAQTKVFDPGKGSPAPAPDPEEEDVRLYNEAAAHFKFENLKFGKDYQPEDDRD